MTEHWLRYQLWDPTSLIGCFPSLHEGSSGSVRTFATKKKHQKTGVSEKKAMEVPALSYSVSVKVPKVKGSAALSPTALVPTGHTDKSTLLEGHPALYSSARGITAGLACPFLPPRHRGSLIPPNPLQLWKQGNIICHYVFFDFWIFFKTSQKKSIPVLSQRTLYFSYQLHKTS